MSQEPATARRDDGSAMISALIVLIAGAAMGLALATVGTLERTASVNFVEGEAVLLIAESLVERSLAELADDNDWDSVIAGLKRSSFSGTPSTPVLGYFGLASATVDLQAETQALWNVGLDVPRWQLYADGGAPDLIGDGLPTPSAYVAAWVADDPVDTDGDPAHDSNGRLMLRVRACGKTACRAIRVVFARPSAYSFESGAAEPGTGGTDPTGVPEVAQFLRRLSSGTVRGAHGVVRIVSWREEQ